MTYRLNTVILYFQNVLQTKKVLFEKYFGLSLFFLFLGFICGNLFGTFLQFFRAYIFWDGFIITITIILIEILNYIYFSKKSISRAYVPVLKFINFYKMGLLLGFFTDAFKVGS